jgi:hypothetical protein
MVHSQSHAYPIDEVEAIYTIAAWSHAPNSYSLSSSYPKGFTSFSVALATPDAFPSADPASLYYVTAPGDSSGTLPFLHARSIVIGRSCFPQTPVPSRMLL